MMRARSRCRRGVMLFAVMVVVAVAALAVGVLSVAQEAEYAGRVASLDRTQQRALAWSGAQAVAALLAEQRQAIAGGETPRLPSEVVLWESEGSSAVVRVLPVGPVGETAVSENSKRALSTLTADELARTGVVGTELAGAAMARKQSGDSVEALVDPQVGLAPSLVLGPVVTSIADAVRAAQEGERTGKGHGAARALAICDVVSPFDAQRALGARGTAEGEQFTARVPLWGEWSDEALKAIDQATSAGVAQRIRDALQDTVPADDGALVRGMIAAKIEPAQWGAVLGAVICSDHPVEVARVDANRAPEAVLQSLPGITSEKASRWVQERQSLDAATRSQMAWPVMKGVLTPEEFAQVAPSLCQCSWLWRVRLVTGALDEANQSEQLEGVQVWDVVVDLAESPPRFASIRDCTLLPVAAGLVATLDATPRKRGGREESAEPSADRSLEAPSASDPPDSDPDSVPDPGAGADDGKDAAPPSKEWRKLGDRMRDEREARSRAETERRAANRAWSSSSADRIVRGRGGATPAPAPGGSASGAEGASNPGESGRSPSDAPAANTPTGGLSGRWRTRGIHP